MEIKTRSPLPPRRSPPPHCCNSLRISSPSDLPQSIFILIMLRLPLKTIFVCKCVSKTWLGMLSDPWFANQYINRSPPDYVFYMRRPQQGEGDRVVVFGSCNGLLLYGYESCPTLFVENPFVGNNTINIPPDTGEEGEEADGKAQEKEYTTHADYTYGIGYSLTSAKYKVVKITQLSANLTEAKLYVLGNSSNSWRSTQNSPPCGEWWNHAGVYIGGALYWFITEPTGNKYSSGSICCLDMETEKFHILPPPPPLEHFKTQFVLMRRTVQGVWY